MIFSVCLFSYVTEVLGGTGEAAATPAFIKQEQGPGGDASAADAAAAAIPATGEEENVDADGDVDMDGARGTKRSASQSGGGAGGDDARRRKKKKKLPGPPLPKNALMQLNEIKPGLVYNLLSQSGQWASLLLLSLL